MPDSWEYPYCQWDLMFHSVAFACSPAMAKQQSMLLRSPGTPPPMPKHRLWWALSDPNPPIGAWAALRIFQIERNEGFGDLPFLRSAMRKLILEYGWWANRNDAPATTCLRVASWGSTTSASLIAATPCPMAPH